MKSSTKTIAIWVVLIVMFLCVYRVFAAPEKFTPGVGLGAMTCLVATTLAVVLVSKRGTRVLAWGAGVFLLVLAPAGAAIGWRMVSAAYGVGIAAVDAVIVGWIAWAIGRNVIDKRWLARFETVVRAPAPVPARALKRLARSRALVALNGADQLVYAGRIAEGEEIARGVATTEPNLVVFRAILLVTSRVARGDLDGARTAIATVRATTLLPSAAELPAILDALVRTAAGEAAAVAAELANPMPEDQAPFVVRMRKLAHADACVASGDRAGAERILAELAASDPRVVERLADTARPLAAVAHAMAHDVPIAPFR